MGAAVDAAGIAGRIPFLRRYGRALTGTQAEGDDLVRATLRWLGEHPAALAGMEPRIALYRALHEMLGAEGAPPHGPEERVLADEAIVGARVRELPPYERAILLLTALEGLGEGVLHHVRRLLGIGDAAADEAHERVQVFQQGFGSHRHGDASSAADAEPR